MALCTICNGGRRSEVDHALVAGTSVRAVAAQFGLSKSAVERHKASHTRRALTQNGSTSGTPAPVTRGVPFQTEPVDINGLLARLTRSLERLERAAVDAADSGSLQGLAAVSGQLHRALEAACKIQGLAPEPAPVAGSGFGITIILPPAVESVPTFTSSAPPVVEQPPFSMAFDFEEVPGRPPDSRLRPARRPEGEQRFTQT